MFDAGDDPAEGAPSLNKSINETLGKALLAGLSEAAGDTEALGDGGTAAA